MPEELSTLQISSAIRDKLRVIADFYRRSMGGQVAWWVERETEELEQRFVVTEKGRQALAETREPDDAAL